jgi:hypothetical protein
MNILEQIVELCRSSSEIQTTQLNEIKRLAERHAAVLDSILVDYIRQNQDNAYRKGRLKAAKRMLES